MRSPSRSTPRAAWSRRALPAAVLAATTALTGSCERDPHDGDDTGVENGAPVVDPIDDATAMIGLTWTLQATATDPEDAPLAWSVPTAPTGLTVDDDGLLTWRPTATGVSDVVVRATDPEGLWGEAAFRVTVVDATPANHAPSIAPLADARIIVPDAWSTAVVAADPDGDTVTLALAAGAPAGLTLDAGTLAWTPTAAQIGTHAVAVTATDPGGLSDTATFTLTVAPNAVPALAPVADLSLRPNTLLAFDLVATDADLPDDLLTYRLDTGVRGLALDSRSGGVRWVPTSDQIGSHDVTVSVHDRRGGADTATFTVTVTAANHPPVLDALDDQRVAVGDVLTLRVPAADPDPGDVLTTTLPRAPAGMMVAGDTLTFAPNADQVGPHDVLVRVVDRAGAVDEGGFVVRVVDANDPPVAVEDHAVTPRGTTTEVAAPGVLANDTDPDGDALTAHLVSGPTQGALDLRADGSFAYTPGEASGPFTPVKAYHARWFDDGLQALAWDPIGQSVAGDLDGDGRAEIVCVSSPGSGIAQGGWITVMRPNPVSGEMDQVWDVHTYATPNPPGAYDDLHLSATPLLVDLDGDGPLELVFPSYCKNEITVFEHDGTLRFTTGVEGCTTDTVPYLLATDLDLDGFPEILLTTEPPGQPGAWLRAFSSVGDVLWETPIPGEANMNGQMPLVAADVDLDGYPEIVAAGSVFDHDGTLRWSAYRVANETQTRFSAVANLDDDPFGEVILLSAYRGLEVLDHDGTCLWRARSGSALGDGCRQITLPRSTSDPQSLVVGDLDDDGAPEILFAMTTPGVGTDSTVYALDADGSVQWSRTALVTDVAPVVISDAIAHDFDGDGVMEVVVMGFGQNDAKGGVIFLDGRDGSTITTLVAGTEHPGEHPAQGNHEILFGFVADVDDDGAGDLVLTSQGGGGDQWAAGVLVYSSGALPWRTTRPAWNQWSYSVTNATPSGDVVRAPTPNWLVSGLNSFRVNQPAPGEPGTYDRFVYAASDGTASDEATVWLDLRRPNQPPAFLGSPSPLHAVGAVYQARVYAVDPDPGDVVTVTLQRGPVGMTLDGDTLRWDAGEAVDGGRGDHPVLLSAQDTEGATTVLAYTLRVLDPVAVPDLTGVPVADADVTLAGAGLLLGRQTPGPHPTVAADAVASQLPVAGSLAPPGTRVDVVVSTGPAPADRDDDLDGFTPRLGDCDDADATRHPGATDGLADGIDQDCDGIDGSVPLVALDLDPDALTLLVFERTALRAYGVLADGSEQDVTAAVTWSATSGVTVDAQGRVFATAPGVATVTATRGGLQASIPVQVAAGDVSDDVAPVAILTSPVDGADVLGPIDVVGSVDDAALVRWDLTATPVGTYTPTLLATGTGPVTGVLGQLDPSVMRNGPVELTLTALDAGAHRTTDSVTVVLTGARKVGLFTLAYVDLDVPMGGLPLDVVRTYDSRDLTPGDFGAGWRLGLHAVTVTCTPELATGWFVAQGGIAYQILPERPHTCSVALPDGVVETFDFEPSPDTSILAPFSFFDGRFVARGSAGGTLDTLDNRHLAILDGQPGEVTLRDDLTLRPFAPTRFRYRTAAGATFTLGPDGLESIVDLSGNRVTFAADRIVHSGGLRLDLTRDGSGRITRIADPLGHAHTYAYNAGGDLVAHTDATGAVTRYAYDRAHHLLRVDDPLGHASVRTTYGDDGRIRARQDASGAQTTWAYDDDAHTITVTLPDGTTQVIGYDDLGRVTSQVTSSTTGGVDLTATEAWTYDEAGNPLVEVDADGIRTERTFDGAIATSEIVDPDGLALQTTRQVDAGRVTRTTDPLGRVTTWSYDSYGTLIGSVAPGGRVVSVPRTTRGLPASVQDAGERVVLTYDSRGRPTASERRDVDGTLIERTERTWDDAGRLTASAAVTFDADGVPQRLTTTFTYDDAGRLLTETDPTGAVTAHAYDAAGQRVQTTDPVGAVTTWTYDARGLVASITHPDGAVETMAYDPAGRLARHTGPTGVVTELAYDGLGRLVARTVAGQLVERRTWTPGGRLATVTDGAGHETAHTYDSAGRLITVTGPEVPVGEDGARVRPERTFAWDAAGRRIATTDPDGAATTIAYDAFGRPEVTTLPDLSTVTQAYDARGQLISATDEAGQRTAFEVDDGRLVAVTLPGDGGPGPVTRYGYDGFGRLRTRTDALGHTTAWDYDDAGRETRRVLPDGAVRTTTWDAAGRMTGRTEPDGTVVTATYDPMGRLLTRTGERPGQAPITESTTWSASGQRLSATDAAGRTTTWTYDATDRPRTVTGPTGTLTYTHDPDGRVLSVDVDGSTTTYGWEDDRLVTVTVDGARFDYRYDLDGHEIGATFPGGVHSTTTHDVRHRPLATTWRGPDDTVLARFTSTWSPTSHRTSLSELDGSVETYTYDVVGRLTAATRTGTSPYATALTYDAVGNLVREVTDGVTTDATFGPNDELLTRGAATFAHDARGQRVSGTVAGAPVTYGWDAFGRLVSVQAGSGTTGFAYDTDDLRVGRDGAGGARAWLYDTRTPTGSPQVVQAEDGTGATVARQWYARRVVQQDAGVGSPASRFVLDDHGSVRALVDASAITDTYVYRPYGALRAHAGASANPVTFAGERWTPEAGAYDLRARSYDPVTASFLSRDPASGSASRPVSQHPYQYASLDPITRVDPSGRTDVIELSVVQGIQAGMNLERVLTIRNAYCRANDAVATVEALALSADVAAFVWNTWNNRGLQFSETWRTRQTEITAEVLPLHVKDGAAGVKFGFSVKASAYGVGGLLEATFHKGKLDVAWGAEVELFKLQTCGVSFGALTLGTKRSAFSGDAVLELGFEFLPKTPQAVSGGKFPVFSFPGE